jgi:hypothetical protein
MGAIRPHFAVSKIAGKKVILKAFPGRFNV